MLFDIIFIENLLMMQIYGSAGRSFSLFMRIFQLGFKKLNNNIKDN